jgi:ABC-type branched-subunit amino acid transport system substrate-binding protein
MNLMGKAAAALAIAATVAMPSMARELTILHVAPFGGALAAGARDYNLGLQLAINEANMASGINGVPLRVVSRDDGNNTDEALRLVDEVIREHSPVALVGLSNQTTIDELIKRDTLASGRMPLIGVRSGVDRASTSEWVFGFRTDRAEELATLTRQLKAIFRTQVAIFHEDEPYTKAAISAFEQAARTEGITIKARATYRPGSLDVDAAVATIVAAQPDAVIVTAATNGAAQFIRKLRPLLRNAQIVVTSETEPEIVVEQIGIDLARGVGMSTVVPSPHRRVLPLVNQMHSTLTRLGLHDVARTNFSTMEGYIVGRTIVAALKRSGNKSDGAALQRVLNSRSRFDLGGLTIDFTEGRKNKTMMAELALIGRDGRVLQ